MPQVVEYRHEGSQAANADEHIIRRTDVTLWVNLQDESQFAIKAHVGIAKEGHA